MLYRCNYIHYAARGGPGDSANRLWRTPTQHVHEWFGSRDEIDRRLRFGKKANRTASYCERFFHLFVTVAPGRKIERRRAGPTERVFWIALRCCANKLLARPRREACGARLGSGRTKGGSAPWS